MEPMDAPTPDTSLRLGQSAGASCVGDTNRTPEAVPGPYEIVNTPHRLFNISLPFCSSTEGSFPGKAPNEYKPPKRMVSLESMKVVKNCL